MRKSFPTVTRWSNLTVHLAYSQLCSLDKESMERIKPIFGLIFLFKWRVRCAQELTNDLRNHVTHLTVHLFIAKCTERK